ncbi:MAG: lamin tail domain-containing protein, partial [Anaerolineales bacterium]
MRNRVFKVILLFLFTIPLLLSVHRVGSSQGTLVPYSAPQSLAEGEEAFITINEVQPIPAGGEPEWVELRTHAFALYLPMIQTSGSGIETTGSQEALQAAPKAAGGPLDFSGWEITDEDGNSYVIPEDLPPAPHNSFVLIIFDGQGEAADDYDFSDGVAELHTPPGLVGVFEDDADQVALYRGETIVDFVAYGGDAGDDDDAAVAAGMWSDGFYTAPTTQIPGGDVLTQSGSFGWFSEQDNNSPDEWVIYRANETTSGADNVPPAPYFRTPPDGIETSDHTIPFGWSTLDGAVGYHFQLSTTSDFSDLLIDEMTPAAAFFPESEIPDGTYYYRVRAEHPHGRFSAFSVPGQVTIVTVEGALTVQTSSVLNVTPQLQHKDSRMLCVDGHQRTGNDRWDSAHENDGDWVIGNGTALRTNPHDDNYCTRASISMVVDFHGGSLSQDRISYYHYDGGPPEGDLGHGIGLWPDQMCTFNTGTAGDDDVLRWAMNGVT